MSAAKIKEVHARRAQLEQEEISLREKALEIADQVKQIEAHVAEMHGTMVRSEVAAVRRGEFYETASEQAAIARDREDIGPMRAEGQAMLAEAKKVPLEIAELHRANFDEFAAVASELADLAVQSIAELEEAYVTAFERWQEATAAWQRAIVDLNHEGYSSHSARIPAWPLPAPNEVFGEVVPPVPHGYLPPAQRKKAPEPGRYIAERGQVYDLEDERAIRSHAHLLEPDQFGFVKLRRIG